MNEEQEIDTVVQKIYQIFKENQCFWVLSGSTSLRLQGVAVPVKKDIDIITNAENAKKTTDSSPGTLDISQLSPT